MAKKKAISKKPFKSSADIAIEKANIPKESYYIPMAGINSDGSYFFKPGQVNWQDLVSPNNEPNQYSVYQATQVPNDVYAPEGGAAKVLQAKQLDPNYKTYDSIANGIYAAGKKLSNDNFGYNDVKKYNTMISENKPAVNSIAVLDDDLQKMQFVPGETSAFLFGYYDPYKKLIRMNDVSYNSPYNYQPSISSTFFHENAHAIQDKINPMKSIKNFKENEYLSSPREIHARAVELNQEYAKNYGEALTNGKTIDQFLDRMDKYFEPKISSNKSQAGGRVINADTYNKDMKMLDDLSLSPKMHGKNPTAKQFVSARYQQDLNDPKYRANFKDISPTLGDVYEQLLNSKAVQDYVKKNPNNPNAARDAIKALIMTTAKGESLVQPANSPFDTGWEIS